MVDKAIIKFIRLENGFIVNEKYYPNLISVIDDYGITKQKLSKSFEYEMTIEIKRVINK